MRKKIIFFVSCMILTKSKIFENKLIKSLKISFYTECSDYLWNEEIECRSCDRFIAIGHESVLRICVEYLQKHEKIYEIWKEMWLFLKSHKLTYKDLSEYFKENYVPFSPELLDVFFEYITEEMSHHYWQTENKEMYEYCFVFE